MARRSLESETRKEGKQNKFKNTQRSVKIEAEKILKSKDYTWRTSIQTLRSFQSVKKFRYFLYHFSKLHLSFWFNLEVELKGGQVYQDFKCLGDWLFGKTNYYKHLRVDQVAEKEFFLAISEHSPKLLKDFVSEIKKALKIPRLYHSPLKLKSQRQTYAMKEIRIRRDELRYALNSDFVIFLRNLMKEKLPEYYFFKVQVKAHGSDRKGNPIPVDNLGKWLFGVPSYRGHINIFQDSSDLIIRYPDVKQTPIAEAMEELRKLLVNKS